MELELEIKGKKRKFKSKEITMRTFRDGTVLLTKFNNSEFLDNNYPISELEEAVDLIRLYFGKQFTVDQFMDGFKVEDSQDFMALFSKVLINIQMNDEKREMIDSTVAKMEAQKQE